MFLDADYDGEDRISVSDTRRDEAFRRCGFHVFVCCNMSKEGIPCKRCPQVVLEARYAGEDILLHEELAAGAQAEGIDRGQRHRPSLHPLRGPDIELGSPLEYGRSEWLKENYLSPWAVLDSLMSIRLHGYKDRRPRSPSSSARPWTASTSWKSRYLQVAGPSPGSSPGSLWPGHRRWGGRVPEVYTSSKVQTLVASFLAPLALDHVMAPHGRAVIVYGF